MPTDKYDAFMSLTNSTIREWVFQHVHAKGVDFNVSIADEDCNLLICSLVTETLKYYLSLSTEQERSQFFYRLLGG